MSAAFYSLTAIVSQPTRLAFRMRAAGVENVPDKGGFILAANHVSIFDPWPVGLLLWPRRQVRFMAKSLLYGNFVLRWFLNGVSAFPVRREARDLDAIANAVRLAQSGEAVGIFPGGHATPQGRAGDVPGRGAHRDRRLSRWRPAMPIVPAGLRGIRTTRLGKFGQLRVSYGKPIPPEGTPRELTARMMGDIERLLVAM